MLALNSRQQSFFVGIRTVFYKVAMLAAVGLIPIVVDYVNGKNTSNSSWGWTVAFITLSIVMLALWLYNSRMLPHPTDTTSDSSSSLTIYKEVIVSFFSKPGVVPSIAFLLLYRLGEAQLAKIATPFLIDDRSNGGLGMSMTDYGIAYGTLGMIALTLGGVVGGWLASKFGLKRLIWPMVAFMNLPNLVYVALAIWQPVADSWTIYAAIITEQLGYGFGFTAYMLFLLLYVGDSKYKTAEYALGTALMALGMMLPGMISGFVQELVGYDYFFIYVVICCIPGTILVKYLRLEDNSQTEE
jgi:PAT family beta-lactamase induction signal transducer AmpG